jgi:glyoxylase-like metal-dependent hydrolase (beta-lactamase superfamily II)
MTPLVVVAPNASPMTLDGTRTYVVGRERPVVIDPGPDDDRHIGSILEALAGAVPVAILLTHAHADHAAAAPRLAKQTGVPIRCAPGLLLDGSDQNLVYLRDAEILATDQGEIRAIATPGHTPDHLAFHWTGSGAPAGGGVFVGDLLMGSGDTTLVAPPEGELGAYLASLARVEALGPSVLFPTHGPPIDDPPAAIERYREHRRERIEQLRAAIAAFPGASVQRLVDEIYGDSLDPALRGAAAGSITAMLRYLGDSRG